MTSSLRSVAGLVESAKTALDPERERLLLAAARQATSHHGWDAVFDALRSLQLPPAVMRTFVALAAVMGLHRAGEPVTVL